MRIWCPECNQGWLHAVVIRALNQNAYICDECEATWLKRNEIGVLRPVSFTLFMQNLGLNGLWSEVTEIDDEEKGSRGDGPMSTT